MSDGQAAADEGIVLAAEPDTAFAQLMGALVADEDGEPAGAGEAAADAAGTGTGAPAPAGQGAPAADVQPAAPAAGAGGGQGVPAGAGSGDAAAPAPGGGTVDAATLEPKWAEVLSGLESRQVSDFESTALTEVRAEYEKYFDAIEQHPRMLVGKTVPSATGEGTETLRDSADAKEWQEAVKLQLAQEVKDRASRKVDEVRPMLETVHASVALFQQNPDLIPRTKGFDKELADGFAKFAKPYELRIDGKLIGYTIPVQGIIDNLREQITSSRAAAATAGTSAAAAPAGPTAQQQRAAEAARNAAGQFTNPDGPQTAITSKAGFSADEEEGFGALFGTISPELRGFRV